VLAVARPQHEANPLVGVEGGITRVDILAPLDPDNARSALVVACAAAGLDPMDAELIRLGSNAVFRLRRQPVIARVARTADRLDAIAREVAVSRWLAANGVRAVLALDIAQPVVAEGRAVTLWDSVSDGVEYGTTAELAAALRHLHTLDAPTDIALPAFDPMYRLFERLERTVTFSSTERDLLIHRADELASAFSVLQFELPTGPIHGDANVGNLLRDRNDEPVLSDLDEFSIGPREWDLTLTAMYFERYGWHTLAEYRTFCGVYGWDVMAWPGYTVLADIKELMMVTWLAQNASEHRNRQELDVRLESLRTGRGRENWKPF
jgi:aminoglycoside phosphotransferase (APT) family kinase protein